MPEGITGLNGLLGLVLTSAVLIAVPGPSIMFLIGQTITVGRSNAFRGVIGNAIGTYCVAVIVSVGIGSLIEHSSYALTIIRLLGAVVLLGIGIQYLAFSRRLSTASGNWPRKSGQSLLAGIIVGATNPKALIMFGSIVPSFMSSGLDSPVLSLLGISLVPIALGLLIDAAWVAAAHSVTTSGLLLRSKMKFLNIVGGALMVAMALLLAMETLR
ncbi:MAG: LysE family translocator [Paraburkholderia sp.]|nr:LysE family translocator [Paraburkholderia sp.]